MTRARNCDTPAIKGEIALPACARRYKKPGRSRVLGWR